MPLEIIESPTAVDFMVGDAVAYQHGAWIRECRVAEVGVNSVTLSSGVVLIKRAENRWDVEGSKSKRNVKPQIKR